MTDISVGLLSFAQAIRKMTWAEMVQISEHISAEVQHMIKSERLDRDGVASVLVELATDIDEQAASQAEGKE